MVRSLSLLVLALVCLMNSLFAADWLTAPSYYTHDPSNGQRVSQYSPIGPVYVYNASNFTRSGYRHLRSTIQGDGSADNFHLVEEWGRPVVPYEQWRFPSRPYGSPYPEWGPPLAGAAPVSGYGFPYGGYYGGGGPGFGGGYGAPGPNYPYYHPQSPAPWIDGYWPSYDNNNRSDYWRSYP